MHDRNRSAPAPVQFGNSVPRPSARKLLLVQSLMGLMVSLLAYYLAGSPALFSALAGTGVALIPNLVFVALAFRHSGARAAALAVKDLYFAEACKFLLTVVLFALVFALLRPLAAEWVFASYIAALSAYWMSPWVMARRLRPEVPCGQTP